MQLLLKFNVLSAGWAAADAYQSPQYLTQHMDHPYHAAEPLHDCNAVLLQVQRPHVNLIVQTLDAAEAIALQPQHLEPRVLLQVLNSREALMREQEQCRQYRHD